jgi:hypothetical protein
MTVPEIILQQLGGRRFAAMTGAFNFTQHEKTLTFKLPRGVKDNINCVQITLAPSDTYTVKFLRIRGTRVDTVSTHDDIYVDVLHDLFTRATGLVTSL